MILSLVALLLEQSATYLYSVLCLDVCRPKLMPPPHPHRPIALPIKMHFLFGNFIWYVNPEVGDRWSWYGARAFSAEHHASRKLSFHRLNYTVLAEDESTSVWHQTATTESKAISGECIAIYATWTRVLIVSYRTQ